MVCSLSDIEHMSRSQLIVEAVAGRVESKYLRSEVKRKDRELKEVRKQMKFQEILSQNQKILLQKKDAEINELKLQVALQSNELDKKKPGLKTKILAVFVSLLLGVSSVLTNVASNFVTSIPPNPIGITLFSVVAIIYVICTLITIFVLGETN